MATGMAPARAKVHQDFENGVGAAGTTPAGHFIQFHKNGDPGALGTANKATNVTRYATGGVGVIWGACSATTGAAANTNTITLTAVPATETYTFFSEWTTGTDGTGVFLASGTVTFGAVVAGSSPTVPVGALVKTFGVAA